MACSGAHLASPFTSTKAPSISSLTTLHFQAQMAISRLHRRHAHLAFHTMDVVTRTPGVAGGEARRPAAGDAAVTADGGSALAQDVVFLYHLVPGVS